MKENIIHSRTCVYNINYHVVWSVKYRRKILNTEIEAYLKTLVQEIANDKSFTVHLFEVGEGDHVHCFVSAPPKLSVTDIVKYLKGITGRKLFEQFPEIREKLWKGQLWNHSYYVETIGSVSEENIRRYIEHQSKSYQEGRKMMLLSHKTVVKLTDKEMNIIGHLCYAASKLWNVCNYERIHYKELELEKYPDWYYQKSHHKEDIWYKALPSQTAQEVCKLLDKSWKSFYTLQRTGGIVNPRPPRFKQNGIAVTYMQNGIKHEEGGEEVRLSLSRKLKEHLKEKYQINDNYLFLKNKIFKNIDKIKQLHIYPPEKGTCEVIVVYEISEVAVQADNGHYLSVDLGLHNLMTCYDSQGASFIMGRKYLSLCRRYDKEIARVQSQWARQQSSKGVKYPKPSKHVRRLYQKKGNSVKDYLHKITHSLVEYCIKNDIKTVIIGDIRNIRKGKDLGSRTNQKLHGLPYEKIYGMLEYKLKMAGIRFVKQEESYTSQCSPYKKDISKETAQKSNRKERGLYVVKGEIFNADAVGAFNIMRKYFAVSGIEKEMSVSGLKSIKVQKVAV